MHSLTPNPRGMALVMSMIVVVLITLLVAGAISFTGTERAAAEVQSQEAAMSACVQAARNLFLSQMAMRVPEDSQGYLPIQFDADFQTVRLKTGHPGSVVIKSARRADITNKLMQVNDRTNITGANRTGGSFYTVTAVCQDTSITNGPEREIEFMVRTIL